MYCINCGKEIENNSTFCTHCGTKQNNAPTGTVENPDGPATLHIPEITLPKLRLPKIVLPEIGVRGKKILFGALGAIVVLTTAITIGTKAHHTMDLNDYITIEFDGYDGYGEAYYNFDEERFVTDFVDKAKFSRAQRKELENLSSHDFYNEYGLLLTETERELNSYGVEKTAKSLLAYVYMQALSENGTLDRCDYLSNGDTVTFSWESEYDMDEEFIEKTKELAGIRFTFGDKEATVSDLEQVPEFDPFENVVLNFHGISSSGIVTIISAADPELGFTLDRNTGLTNGDIITLSVTCRGSDRIEDFITTCNKTPSALTKRYVVSGLTEYVTDSAQITDDFVSELFTAAKKDIDNSYAQDTTFGLTGVELLGYYVMTAKDLTAAEKNQIILVTHVNSVVRPEETDVVSRVDYTYFSAFSNISCDENGKLYADTDNIITPQHKLNKKVYVTTSRYYEYNYSGYDTPTSLYKEYVKNYESGYNVKYVPVSEGSLTLLTSNSQITDEFVVEAANFAADMYRKYTSEKWDKLSTFDGIEYIGRYFTYSENEADNHVVLVFRVLAHENNYPGRKDFSYYYTAKWNNLYTDGNNIIYEKHNLENPELFQREVRNNTYFSYTRYYCGYSTFNSLYNSEIQKYVGAYTIEQTGLE